MSEYLSDAPEPFKLIDVFKTDEPVIDQWTFVFGGVNPLSGFYTMLATDSTGVGFSQFCEGMYDPDGDNTHLGERPRLISEYLVNHMLARMTDGYIFGPQSALADFLERADMPQDEGDESDE